MTFSNVNLPPEQCAILRTFCLYHFRYPDSLIQSCRNCRVTSRRVTSRRVTSRRVASCSVLRIVAISSRSFRSSDVTSGSIAPDGACSTYWAIKNFYTKSHFHRLLWCTDILFYKKLQRVSHIHFMFRKVFAIYAFVR